MRACLGNVGVVLVSPKSPENIGSVLRIAGNFGAGKVVLVEPVRCNLQPMQDGQERKGDVIRPYETDKGGFELFPLDSDGDVVRKVSRNSPLLEGMEVVPTLSHALASCTDSLCFTRRSGGQRRVHESLTSFCSSEPRFLRDSLLRGTSSSQTKKNTSSAHYHDDLDQQQQNIMLVFGREENGLLDEEISLCHHAVSIPSNKAFASLNLSHAVAVVLSRLYEYVLSNDSEVAENSNAVDFKMSLPKDASTNSLSRHHNDCQLEDMATHSEINSLLLLIAQVLVKLEISTQEQQDSTNHGRRRLPFGHLRSLLMKSRASTVEVRSLFKLVKQVLSKLE
jgi:tRNA C32,U32 (ribose-2'-O)-methylase TrmJ